MKKPRRSTTKTYRPRTTARVSKPRRTKVPTPNFWRA